MRRVFQRMFGGVGIFLSRLFSLGIPLWFVILILLLIRLLIENKKLRDDNSLFI